MSNDQKDNQATMSAQVVLTRSAQPADQPITSANIAGAFPDDEQVDAVRAVFALLGFDVADAFAGSFAIVGSAQLFDTVFPSAAAQYGMRSCAQLHEFEAELPLSDLVDALGNRSGSVQAVVFTAPPAFGPGNP
jgi:hypothetical protein